MRRLMPLAAAVSAVLALAHGARLVVAAAQMMLQFDPERGTHECALVTSTTMAPASAQAPPAAPPVVDDLLEPRHPRYSTLALCCGTAMRPHTFPFGCFRVAELAALPKSLPPPALAPRLAARPCRHRTAALPRLHDASRVHQGAAAWQSSGQSCCDVVRRLHCDPRQHRRRPAPPASQTHCSM